VLFRHRPAHLKLGARAIDDGLRKRGIDGGNDFVGGFRSN
jgi:hypothetical protein